MKNFNFKNILSPLTKAALSLAVLFGMSACDSAIYDFGDNCDPLTQPEPENPEPEDPVKPGYIRIYVRSNPGGGGTSAVYEDNHEENSTSTHRCSTRGRQTEIVDYRQRPVRRRYPREHHG